MGYYEDIENRNGKIRVFSTFSGIGGFEKGITAAIGEKAEFIAYSEIDKYAIKVYERNFNGNIRCLQPKGDEIKQNIDDTSDKLQQRKLSNNRGVKNYGDITQINAKELPDFDCLVGGFPCQAFSVAGKRKGFEDTRGTLFFDLARILRAKQPRLFIFENVKGLLSHDSGRTFKTIIETIDELGYDCQWQVLNSKNFGVPQNRERVYIVGHLRGTPRPEVFPITGTDSADTFIRTIRTGGAASYTEKHARDIIQVNRPTHSNDRVYASDGISPTLNTMQGGNRQPFTAAQRGRGEPPVQQLEARPDDITNTITSVQKDNMVMIPEATKKGYAEAKVGDAINLTAINSKTRRGRVSDIAPTVDTGMQLHTLTEDVKIRRLTPMECERLQGFPDNWTAEGIDGPISDSQRYKMAGNAVTVNVVEAVFRRIFDGKQVATNTSDCMTT